jgi:hypothetical protein
MTGYPVGPSARSAGADSSAADVELRRPPKEGGRGAPSSLTGDDQGVEEAAGVRHDGQDHQRRDAEDVAVRVRDDPLAAARLSEVRS